MHILGANRPMTEGLQLSCTVALAPSAGIPQMAGFRGSMHASFRRICGKPREGSNQPSTPHRAAS